VTVIGSSVSLSSRTPPSCPDRFEVYPNIAARRHRHRGKGNLRSLEREIKAEADPNDSLSEASLDHQRSNPGPPQVQNGILDQSLRMQKKVITLVEVVQARAGETLQTEWHQAEGNRRVAPAAQCSQAAREGRGGEGEGGKERTSETHHTHTPNTHTPHTRLGAKPELNIA
jgi:hypothetical protein